VRLAAALAAFERGDRASAWAGFERVATAHPATPVGEQALVLLVAMEADPRDPVADPLAAAARAGQALRSGVARGWTVPVLETLYLLALEVGAADSVALERVERAAADSAVRGLPRLPGLPLAARLRALEAEREQLARRVARLEEELARKDAELAKRDQELARIRKTLKP